MGYAGHVFRPIPRRTGRLRNGSCSARKPCPHGDDNGRRRLPRLDALAPGLGSDPASGHSALCSGPERSRGSVGCSAVRLSGKRFPAINPRDRSLSHADTTPRTPTPLSAAWPLNFGMENRNILRRAYSFGIVTGPATPFLRRTAKTFVATPLRQEASCVAFGN